MYFQSILGILPKDENSVPIELMIQKYSTNTNTQWIQIQIQYNTYIFIYSYIRSDSFPNKKVILKRAPNFPEYFFPIFRSLCIFPNFWYFPNFQFFAQLFLQIFWSIFPNGPPGYFFEFTKVFFSKFWRSISLNFEYLS